MSSMSDFKTEIKKSEGNISHMYLDTKGKVTVGVGNMLPDTAAAKKLDFVVRATKKKATDDEIETDFEKVSGQTKGLVASSYKKHTELDLADGAADALLDLRIAEFTKQLRTKFPKFDTYPEPARMALLDMAFNLGTHGLVTKFPSLKKAVEARDWTTAAAESSRKDVQASRNATTKAWFLEAVTIDATQSIFDCTTDGLREAMRLWTRATRLLGRP